jgi:hypothetical protein
MEGRDSNGFVFTRGFKCEHDEEKKREAEEIRTRWQHDITGINCP